jgi:hypothetical protein
MTLRGVELADRMAVASGGFSDIFKMLLRGQEIAVKVLKVFQRTDKVRLLKVGYPSPMCFLHHAHE